MHIFVAAVTGTMHQQMRQIAGNMLQDIVGQIKHHYGNSEQSRAMAKLVPYQPAAITLQVNVAGFCVTIVGGLLSVDLELPDLQFRHCF